MTPKLTDATLTFNTGVATLTFDRHDVRNALTGTALAQDIIDTVEWINNDESVAVLIITGNGSSFSAGGNVKDMAEKKGDFSGTPDELEQKYQAGIQRIPLAIDALTVPVIAAINGPAIGAGFDLANMCDFRIASSKAKFGETFINLGLIPGDGGAWFMQRLIGYQKAAELTFTGRVIDADEAMRLGLLLKVVEPEALLDEANILAKSIAEKPRAATRMTKQLMKSAQNTELAEFLKLCAKFQGQCHHNPEHLTAVNKLLDQMKR